MGEREETERERERERGRTHLITFGEADGSARGVNASDDLTTTEQI